MSADSPTPTPAAPAGSGWLTMGDFVAERSFAVVERNATLMRPLSAVEHLAAWIEEAHAQRAAREAAERERDEAYASHSAVAEIAIRGGIKGLRDSNRIATLESALAASTEREAGLRALCEEALQVAEAYCPRQRDIGDCASCDALRARLASLAAPEGGTDGK